MLNHSVARTVLRVRSGGDGDTQAWRELACPKGASNYQRFIAAVRAGTGGEPDFHRAAELHAVFDRCGA